MTTKNYFAHTEEQMLYAAWLKKGMLVGLVLLMISFVLYLFGILVPVVPPEQLANYWTLSAAEYVAAVNRDFLQMDSALVGWTWLKLISKGDFLNFLPIAILSGTTILCYLAMVPVFWKKKDKAYLFMSIAEVLILILAASGLLLAVGH
jgi:uncharacterized membrane protein